jgi:hypothetical protein
MNLILKTFILEKNIVHKFIDELADRLFHDTMPFYIKKASLNNEVTYACQKVYP